MSDQYTEAGLYSGGTILYFLYWVAQDETEEALRRAAELFSRWSSREQTRQRLFYALGQAQLLHYLRGGRAAADCRVRRAGALRSFVQVSAVRTARSLLRRCEERPGGGGEDELEQALAEPEDPELWVLRQRYGAPFRQAFLDTLGTLSAEQRGLLRLHFTEGINLMAIGAMYGVNKSTVSRWLASARAAVFDGTLRLLGRACHTLQTHQPHQPLHALAVNQKPLPLEHLGHHPAAEEGVRRWSSSSWRFSANSSASGSTGA